MIRVKKRWLLPVSCMALLAGMYLARGTILRQIGLFLVVSDPVEKADFIFLLNGDATVRPPRAASLLKQGYAPKVVICRAEDGRLVKSGLVRNVTDLSIAVLEQEGVAKDQIVQLPFEGGVTSTFDEAARLRKHAEATGARRVLVVTSAIHTRRSRWVIRHALGGHMLDVRMIPAVNPVYDASNWWLVEDGFLGTQSEYMKLVYYLIRYR